MDIKKVFASTTLIKEVHALMSSSSAIQTEQHRRDQNNETSSTSTPPTPTSYTILSKTTNPSVVQLGKKDLSRYFNSPQGLAARLLGVSLSQLKKRYYELFPGRRWPYQLKSLVDRKQSIYYLLNENDKNEKDIDEKTLATLLQIFENTKA